MPLSDAANTAERPRSDWNDEEIDKIVREYFEILSLELKGQAINKKRRNEELRVHLERSHAAVEYKHRNISRILDQLGMPWIKGYLPAANIQGALVAGVERYLAKNPEPLPLLSEMPLIMAKGDPIIEDPPELTEGAFESPEMRKLLINYDYGEQERRNRELGKLGEERVFNFERSRLRAHGHEDLAKKVRWVAKDDGDGAGFDILSFSPEGLERLLEVKTTAGSSPQTVFYLSEKERALSVEEPTKFRIFRLYNFFTEARAFELEPPLAAAIKLRAISYRASFR